jgi:fatty-acyl-CoA synthase
MKSTMQSTPLSVARLLTHGSTVHGASRVATWTGDGVVDASYSDVGGRAAALAHALRSLGITGDQRVATFMFNNQAHLEAYLAVPSMGAVLHTLNIRLFPDQLSYIVNHADDQVVIVDAAVLPLFARIAPSLKTVRHVVVNGPVDPDALSGADLEVHSYQELLAPQPTEFDWPDVDEDDAAALCYTSGTTGHPKGVAYSHRSIWLHSMEICMHEGFGLSDADLVLAVVPQFHAMAWGLPYAAMMSGASLLMPDRFLQADPLLQMIVDQRPTFAAAVPTIWSDLLRALDDHGGDVSSLREVVVGGSAVPPSLMHGFHDRYGLRIIHAWGMTETSPLGSVARPPHTASQEEEWAYRYSQGRVPAGVEARLVGPDGEPMPWDGISVGELEVRGPWITGDYFHDPDPEKFDDGWLRTGDVGRLTPDGYLTLTDRAKDVIKSGGEWISSVELENLLIAHDDVVEASVVGIPDARWGERPLATVVLREGATTTVSDLRKYLAEHVARWQVPEYWALIDEVPKTSVGKFDKKVLRSRYAAGELDVTTLD